MATIQITAYDIKHNSPMSFEWIPTDPPIQRLTINASKTTTVQSVIKTLTDKYEAEGRSTLIMPRVIEGRRPNGYAKAFEGMGSSITTGRYEG